MAGTDVMNRSATNLVSSYAKTTTSAKGNSHKLSKVGSNIGNTSSRRNNNETGSTRTHPSQRTGSRNHNSHHLIPTNRNTNASAASGVRSSNSSTGAGRSVSRSRNQGGRTSGSMRTGRTRQRQSEPNIRTGRASRHNSRDANTAPDDVDNKKQQQQSVPGDDATLLPPITRLSKEFVGKSDHAPSPRTLPVNGQSGGGNSLPGFPFSRLATRGGGMTPDLHGNSTGQKNTTSDSVFTGTNNNGPLSTPNLVNYGHLGRALTSNSMAVVSSSSPDPLKSLEQSRRSPTTDSADKAKIKFEKKVLNTMTENDGALQVPSSPRLLKNASPTEGHQTKLPDSGQGPNRDLRSRQRRTSMKSDNIKPLPKVAPAEEPPFSIRQKIEQFRKWHEEQYTDKLKQLKVDGDQKPTEQSLETVRKTGPIDFAKILEDNIIQNRKTEIAFKRRHEKQLKGVAGDVTGQNGDRPMSSATWKTWRDINESDAYNDVQKYIQDNDLMDEEREKWIKLWIADVHTAMEQMGEELIITDDD